MTERISESTKPQTNTFHLSSSEVEKEERPTPPPSSYQAAASKKLTLPSLEQRKNVSWNADVTGQTGYKWDIPGFKATNLRSKNRILNEVYRGINNTAGLGAGVVNYANNVAGSILIDFPAKAEEISVKYGGPSYSELVISAQMATPCFPWDDALAYGLSRIAQFSKRIDLSIQISTKIEKQVLKRGWTPSLVKSTIENPVKTVATRDTRYVSIGQNLDEPATAYFSREGGYVVRNDRTGDIVQVSNRLDPNWQDPF